VPPPHLRNISRVHKAAEWFATASTQHPWLYGFKRLQQMRFMMGEKGLYCTCRCLGCLSPMKSWHWTKREIRRYCTSYSHKVPARRRRGGLLVEPQVLAFLSLIFISIVATQGNIRSAFSWRFRVSRAATQIPPYRAQGGLVTLGPDRFPHFA